MISADCLSDDLWSVLLSWLSAKDIARLDVSFTMKYARAHFLSMLQKIKHLDVINIYPENVTRSEGVSYLQFPNCFDFVLWHSARGILHHQLASEFILSDTGFIRTLHACVKQETPILCVDKVLLKMDGGSALLLDRGLQAALKTVLSALPNAIIKFNVTLHLGHDLFYIRLLNKMHALLDNSRFEGLYFDCPPSLRLVRRPRFQDGWFYNEIRKVCDHHPQLLKFFHSLGKKVREFNVGACASLGWQFGYDAMPLLIEHSPRLRILPIGTASWSDLKPFKDLEVFDSLTLFLSHTALHAGDCFFLHHLKDLYLLQHVRIRLFSAAFAYEAIPAIFLQCKAIRRVSNH